ncbi:MAG: hypothetical protein ACK422_02875, partial [Burkholderiales bacterium]
EFANNFDFRIFNVFGNSHQTPSQANAGPQTVWLGWMDKLVRQCFASSQWGCPGAAKGGR